MSNVKNKTFSTRPVKTVEEKRSDMDVKCNMSSSVETSMIERQDGRCEEMIHVQNIPKQKKEDVMITASWEFPIIDIAGRWHPMCRFDRSIKADWSYGERTMSSISAPVITFFNEKGDNRGTFAVSEALKEVRMNLGVHEEDGTMKCVVYVNLGKYDKGDYTVRILSDFREVPYEKAIAEVGKWWEEDCAFYPAKIPEAAKDPMYSFWYSYHQEFSEQEVEEECRRAREMGFKAAILDDGWQTDDTNRGYGYCGDWEVAEKKIKDMKKHIQVVHDMGMKYLIWYSVPYVGMYSKMWERFADKLIAVDEEQHAGVLDIRYQEVREYLSDIYVEAVKKWDLDGLKLDFIDEFYERSSTPEANAEMDCSCLQEALNRLLAETMKKLKAVKPDILIEFRQRYIGPAVRQYGNMLRVCDCPNSGLTNRIGTIDLRLLSGNTAVHSDPVMWNRNEKVEIAALQIIDCLFATLQFSVRIDTMSCEQKQMVQNYMAFMRDNRKLLQETPLEAKEPHNLYPEVRVSDENTEIIALYSGKRVVRLHDEQAKSIIVNGTQETRIYIETERESGAKITVLDCCGKEISKTNWLLSGIQSITCTVGGRVIIEKRR